jgi:trk system potassium uptake protein
VKIIVVGCGRLGAELASRLYERGHEVSVIDRVESAFNNLPAKFSGRLCEGDALNQEVLHRSGILSAEAVAAVTNSDALNVVVGHTATKIFKIPRVVVRNYNPSCRSIYEVFGLQVVSSTSWGAQRIEEMIYHSQLRAVYSAGNGEVEIYQIIVYPEWNGSPIGKLLDGKECIPIALTRGGKAILPGLDTIMQTGDIMHVSATFAGISIIRDRLNLPVKEK